MCLTSLYFSFSVRTRTMRASSEVRTRSRLKRTLAESCSILCSNMPTGGHCTRRESMINRRKSLRSSSRSSCSWVHDASLVPTSISRSQVANERAFFHSLMINPPPRSIPSQPIPSCPPVPEETPKRTYLHSGAFLPRRPSNEFPHPRINEK
jgi:hypothetical protein